MNLQSDHVLQPALYRIRDVIKLVNLGKTTLYAEIAAGRLKIVKLGRSTLIREEDLRAWLDGLTRGTGGTA